MKKQHVDIHEAESSLPAEPEDQKDALLLGALELIRDSANKDIKTIQEIIVSVWYKFTDCFKKIDFLI